MTQVRLLPRPRFGKTQRAAHSLVLCHSLKGRLRKGREGTAITLYSNIAERPDVHQRPHPCVCSMTSGAIQQGVPTKVLRATGWFPQDPPRSMVAATPKSASNTWPVLSISMLPACKQSTSKKLPCRHIPASRIYAFQHKLHTPASCCRRRNVGNEDHGLRTRKGPSPLSQG